MKCKYCGNKMHDLTHGKGKHRNWICLPSRMAFGARRVFNGCLAHNWKDKWYTQAEWDKWINEEENVS